MERECQKWSDKLMYMAAKEKDPDKKYDLERANWFYAGKASAAGRILEILRGERE